MPTTEKLNKHMLSIFKIMGMPKVTSWEDTGIKPATLRRTQEMVRGAPMSGVLIVSGISSPVVQELFKKGRKVAAIDYVELFNARFTEEDYTLPSVREGQVTVIFNVGAEPVKNFEYTSKILQSLLSKFGNTGLCIVETHLSPSNFNTQYGLDIKNKLIIPKKEESVWT